MAVPARPRRSDAPVRSPTTMALSPRCVSSRARRPPRFPRAGGRPWRRGRGGGPRSPGCCARGRHGQFGRPAARAERRRRAGRSRSHLMSAGYRQPAGRGRRRRRGRDADGSRRAPRPERRVPRSAPAPGGGAARHFHNHIAHVSCENFTVFANEVTMWPARARGGLRRPPGRQSGDRWVISAECRSLPSPAATPRPPAPARSRRASPPSRHQVWQRVWEGRSPRRAQSRGQTKAGSMQPADAAGHPPWSREWR